VEHTECLHKNKEPHGSQHPLQILHGQMSRLRHEPKLMLRTLLVNTRILLYRLHTWGGPLRCIIRLVQPSEPRDDPLERHGLLVGTLRVPIPLSIGDDYTRFLLERGVD